MRVIITTVKIVLPEESTLTPENVKEVIGSTIRQRMQMHPLAVDTFTITSRMEKKDT